MNNKRSQAIDGEAKAKPKVIKLGLDLHVRQVTECRQLDGSTPKPAQQWDPWKLLDQVKDWVKAGIKVYAGIRGVSRLFMTLDWYEGSLPERPIRLQSSGFLRGARTFSPRSGTCRL
jgi:hypothetical protein